MQHQSEYLIYLISTRYSLFSPKILRKAVKKVLDHNVNDHLTDLLIGLEDTMVCPVNDLQEILIMLVENGLNGRVDYYGVAEDCCSLLSVHCKVTVDRK